MPRSRRLMSLLVTAAIAMLLVPADPGRAEPPDKASAETVTEVPNETRAQIPEDRYAMAGGCYAIRPAEGAHLTRAGDGYGANGADVGGAEPFHFQATDLGSYLLFDSGSSYLAAREGVVAEAVYPVTRSTPGGIVGGVAHEQTDAAADEVARSEANRASGRGAGIAAADPSVLADWEIVESADGGFELGLADDELGSDRWLVADADGELSLQPSDDASSFGFELTQGCAAFPEIEINVAGPVVGGETAFEEVRGYLEGHLHMMAFDFIGGRTRCGKPWHRYGVAHALVDCPDHAGMGVGAVLEQVLSGFGPHNPEGWPSFAGWPRPESLTHEQVYYRWLERGWRGGLRLMVNLLVDNRQLCEVYPYRNRDTCNEMVGVQRQHDFIFELQDYIDAQSGGPGEGWFRIVTDPFQARRVINEGKLAVVLGIEVSVPLDCGLRFGEPQCDHQQVRDRLQAVYDGLDVRQMELVNKFDNALSGVTGDTDETGIVVNAGNFGETGQFWQLETCDEGEPSDKHQHNIHENVPEDFPERDAIFGGVLSVTGTSGAAPLYPQGPHCNVRGLTDLGKTAIAKMAELGMIFDPDHMSARARTQSLDFIELGGDDDDPDMPRPHGLPYSGVFSSHGWADDSNYPRIYELGGTITPHAGGSTGFFGKYLQHREWADERFYFGIGFGSDMNGFSAQGQPREPAEESDVDYPFEGFGGVTVGPQVSGDKTYDINTDGVAHYGLYPDWIEDLRVLAGDQIIADMVRGPEAYLQMWERAVGIPPDACRSDVADLTDADVARLSQGMTWEEVLTTLGQPSSRSATIFTYCLSEGRTATLELTSAGTLATWTINGGEVEPRETSITLTDAVASKNLPATARASLWSEGRVLPGKPVSFYIEDRIKGETAFTLLGTVTTDADGLASLEIPARYISKNKRELRASFAGDTAFLGSSATAFAYRV